MRKLGIVLSLLIFVSVNAFAVEFLPPGAGGNNKPMVTKNRQVAQPQAPMMQRSIPQGAKVVVFPEKSNNPVKSFMENRITVNYLDYPVSVEVSGSGVNVIKVPYRIKYVDTSRNLEQIGKGDFEFTVVVADGEPIDLAIVTVKKTFLVTLVPVAKPSVYVDIKDARQAKERACKIERKYDYVDLMGYLIASAVRDGEIRGYARIVKNTQFKYQGLPVILKEELRGASYSVFIYELKNIFTDALRITDDSKAVIEIIKKTAGRPSAIYVSDEFIKPYKSALIYAVVPYKRNAKGRIGVGHEK